MDEFPMGVKPFFLQKDYDKNNWEWTNKPETFSTPIPKNTCFELYVSGSDFDKANLKDFPDRYKKTTENIQWLIKKAIQNKLRFRPMGSGWSLSKVAVTNGGIINTKKMTLLAQLGPNMVSKEFLSSGGDPDNLVFTQCGNMVISINEFLEARGKSLRASGGSNGQTIIGALSTGTHGAAYKFGALSEFVHGLHIVVGPDRHVWLERKSRPMTSEAFRKDKLGITETIIDDDLFNSALISFGSFGFIHGVLIEVEPKFLLQQELTKIPYNDALIKAMTTYDFSGILPYLVWKDEEEEKKRIKDKLPDTDNKFQKLVKSFHKNRAEFEKHLYHFELAINQYDFDIANSTREQVYLRIMYKLPYESGYSNDDGRKKNYTYGEFLPALMADLVDKLGKVATIAIPSTVNSLFKTAYDRPASATGTVGETFKNSIFKGKLFSAGFSFHRKDVPRLVKIIVDLVKKKPFAGVMAMRYVKGTKATLGWTYFDDTCVLELDGVDAEVNHVFLAALADKVQAEGIPYGTHWGKTNTFLNKDRVKYMYGDKINKWLKHRSQLMDAQTREVFNNWFIKNCGLDQEPSAEQPII